VLHDDAVHQLTHDVETAAPETSEFVWLSRIRQSAGGETLPVIRKRQLNAVRASGNVNSNLLVMIKSIPMHDSIYEPLPEREANLASDASLDIGQTSHDLLYCMLSAIQLTRNTHLHLAGH